MESSVQAEVQKCTHGNPPMPTLQLRMRNIINSRNLVTVGERGVLYAVSVELTEKNFYGCIQLVLKLTICQI